MLERSDSFKELLTNVRDHKINTKNSFSRVKDKHRDYESKMREYEARIRELEGIISSMQMVEADFTIKKTSKRRSKKK